MNNKIELDFEAEWFKVTLRTWLDKFAKVVCFTSYLKRWWNDKVVWAKKTWTKEKKRLENCLNSNKELKKAHNVYYYTI